MLTATNDAIQRPTPWQNRCLKLSQWSAIGVGFSLPFSTSATDILFISAVLAYLASNTLKQLYNDQFGSNRNTIALILMGAFTFMLLGVSYTQAPINDIIHSLHKYQKLAIAAILFPVFSDVLTKKRSLLALLVSLFIFMLITYIAYYHVLPISGYRNDPQQQAAIFKNHIASNFLMALFSYFLAYLMIYNRPYRWLFTILWCASTYNVLYLSSGRSGYIIFIVLMLLLAWQRWRLKGIASVSLLLLFLLLITYQHAPTFRKRLQQAVTAVVRHDIHASTGERIAYAKNSLRLIKESPVIGFGTGSFAHQYKRISGWANYNPHNEYLHIGVQFGVFGILLLIAMMLHQWWTSFSLSQPYKAFAQAIICTMLIGFCINSWLMDTTQGHIYVYMLAICFSRTTPKIER